MPNVPLTFACGLYDRMLPLYTGEVPVEGVDFKFVVEDNPRVIFDNMAARQAIWRVANSPARNSSRASSAANIRSSPSRCSPRACFATASFSSTASTSRTRRTLPASGSACRCYTMTAAVFIRGLLSDEHGIDFSNTEWVEGAINSPKKHGNPTVLPTARKKLSIVANQSGKSLSQLLEEGELQAIIGTDAPEAFGRNPDIVRLYPDYRAAEMDYYKRTKIFPIMHLVVIRRDLHDKNPAVANNLFRPASAPRTIQQEKIRYRGTLRYMLPWMHAEVDDIDKVFGGDPWPYGVEPNRPTLEALVRYLAEQGIIAKAPRVDDLFVPVGTKH